MFKGAPEKHQEDERRGDEPRSVRQTENVRLSLSKPDKPHLTPEQVKSYEAQERDIAKFLAGFNSVSEQERAQHLKTFEALAEQEDFGALRKAGLSLKENRDDPVERYRRLAGTFLKAVSPSDLQNSEGRMEFLVDFQGNELAEWHIGAGHCLPPNVSKIKVSGEGEEHVGERAIREGRIGYFDANGEYIAIHSGYRIEVLETTGEDKARQQMENERRFYEEEERKIALRPTLLKFFEQQGIRVSLDEKYFEKTFSTHLAYFEQKHPDWWDRYLKDSAIPGEWTKEFWRSTLGEGNLRLLKNLSFIGEEIALSELDYLESEEGLAPLRERDFSSAADVEPYREFLRPRSIKDANEEFERATDSEGHVIFLRRTAMHAWHRANSIAKEIAKSRGTEIKLVVTSSYRDQHEQEEIRRKSEAKRGADVDKWAAKAGHSNHHTGGTIDVFAYERKPGADWAKNQNLLQEILPRAGWVNYPVEDWHWEIGTRRWAETRGIRSPLYAKVLDRSGIRIA